MENIKELINLYKSASVLLINGVKASDEDFRELLARILTKKINIFTYIYGGGAVVEVETVEGGKNE